MDDTTYIITLADGTVLSGLRLNGNTFVSEVPIDNAAFDGNCSPVIISDGETEEIHDNMAPVPCAQPVKGEYWFVLRDLAPEELREMQTEANIEYLAMMTGVEL